MWLLSPQNRTQLHNTVSGENKRIKSTDCLLLQLLVEHQGKTVSKEAIASYVWQGRIVSESSLTQAIAQLRLALGDSGKEQKFIKTLPRKGYMLIPDVITLAPANNPPEQPKIISVISNKNEKNNTLFSSAPFRIPTPNKKTVLYLFTIIALCISTLIYTWGFDYYQKHMTSTHSWYSKKSGVTTIHFDDNPGSNILLQTLSGELNKQIKHLFISKNPEHFYISCIYLSERLNEENALNLTFSVDLPFHKIKENINEACY